jgi:hypothetical protein
MTEFEFSRAVATDRITRNAFCETIRANPGELEAVASRLKIEAMASLNATFELRYVVETGMFEVEGAAEADLTEKCLVSGEAFSSHVTAPVHARFTTDPSLAEVFDPESLSEWDDPELIENGSIDIGELAVQYIALTLDPYPVKPGVECPDTMEFGKPASPFAILQSLKNE